MADPMVKFAEEDAKTLAEINERRKALGLEPFAKLNNEAERWAFENPAAEPVKQEQAAAEPPKQAEEVKPAEATAKKFTAPDVFAPKAGGADPVVDELKGEIQRLKSEQGRSTVLAGELKQAKSDIEALKQQLADAARKAEELSAKSSDDAILSSLTPEEIEELGGSTKAANVILKLAKSVLKTQPTAAPDMTELQNIKRELEERRTAEASYAERVYAQNLDKMFSDEVAKEVPPEVYGEFANSQKWSEWNSQTWGGVPNWQLYKSAREALDGQAVIDLFKRFMRFAGIEVPSKGSKPPLRSEAKTGSEAVNTESQNGKPIYRFEEITRINEDFRKRKTLPSGWTMQKFMEESDKWEQAQAEGRVVDANGKKRVDSLYGG